MKIFFTSFIFLLLSCVNNNSKEFDLANTFIQKHLSEKLKHKNKQKIVFILNPSECNPCENEINKFLYEFKGKKTINIIPYGKKTTYKTYGDLLNFKGVLLAQYGLLNANGSVLIIENNKCVFYKSIDIQNIRKLSIEIENILDKYK